MKKTSATTKDVKLNNKVNFQSNKGQSDVYNQLVNFLDCANGITYTQDNNKIIITQKDDLKIITLNINEIDKIISRKDFDGSEFIQLNFKNETKALVTKQLVGFKPLQVVGFDSAKIPKVVTTVDLKSVLIAIEDLYDEESLNSKTELELLKRAYQSILFGAEAVGFSLTDEKEWYFRNLMNNLAASA